MWKPTQIRPIPFEVSCDLVRPGNTNTYTIGDIVNDTSLDVLPTLDFSSLIDLSVAGPHRVQIIAGIIKSSYGAATLKLNAQVFFYTIAAIQAHCADEVAFAPTYANQVAYCTGRLDDVSNSITIGSGVYEVMQTEVSRIVTLSDAGKIYPAIVASNAYVGASGETLRLTVKGFLL